MSTILEWLIQNSIVAAVLIPLVWLVCRFFRDRPALQHALWLLILLKLVTPPLVTWPWSMEELGTTIRSMAPASSPFAQSSLQTGPQISLPETPDQESDRAPVFSRTDPVDAGSMSISPLPSGLSEATQPQPANPTNGSWFETAQVWSSRIVPVTFGAWIAGAILCLIRHLRQLLRHARLVQSGMAAPRLLVDEVGLAARQLKLEAPKIVIVRRIVSPFLWCLGNIRLVWPEAMANTPKISRARAIIGHELAHLSRRDHWIAWLELGAGVIWWWNPLFWFVRNRLRETAEMACDALAIAAQPEARREYAEMLLELSAGFPAGSPAAILGVSPGTPASFERRFSMILSHRVSGQRSWPGMLILIALGLLALPHWSAARQAPIERQERPDPRPEAQPQPITAAEKPTTDDGIFTAWGKQTGGLQAGLGFYANERRAYQFGETARVAVRVKNVSKETVKFQYLHSFFDETPPLLLRQDGQPVQFKAAAISSAKYDLPKSIELAPGKEIELYQVKIELKPNVEQEAGPHLKLFGSGIFTMRYDRLIGPSSISMPASDPILSQLSTGPLALAVRPHSYVKSDQPDTEQPRWFAEGSVVGPDGKPMKDVEIWVHSGIGSLKGGSMGHTDAQGKYRVEFHRGMLMGRESSQLQVANITAYRPGFAEKNLNRHGAGTMAVRAVGAQELKNYGAASSSLALPGVARKVDFVMVPAGRIEGRLVGTGSFSRMTPAMARETKPKGELPIVGADERNRSPLAGWKVWLTGPELPPASSVYASAFTDQQGRFVVEDIPVGFKWKLMTDTNLPGNREPVSKEFQLQGTDAGRTIPIELELKSDQKEVFLQFTQFTPSSSSGPSNTPKPDRPELQDGAKRPSARAVEEKSTYTAWGPEIGGLQAGLGFLAGQKRTYRQGETAKVVIRIRNVGKENVKFHYTNVYFTENFPVVIDGQGKTHPAIYTGYAEGGQRSIGVDLAPGKEMALHEQSFDLQSLDPKAKLRPQSAYGAKNLYGSGKFLIQYERVTGPSSGNRGMHDPILSNLPTGKLELEIQDGLPDAAPNPPKDDGADAKQKADKGEIETIENYVRTLRAAVKNPADSQHVYRLVIDAKFRKALHWAAAKGDDALVAELVRNYCGPSNPDRGGTSLTWTAWLNDTEAVKILLGRGVNVNGTDSEGRTALHEGAHWGAEMTRLLLDGGADVNAPSKKGVTPLMMAAGAHSSEPVRLILAKGADVNARDNEGKTPLMCAASQGRLANAEFLLAKGAEVRFKDKAGKTALDLVRSSSDAFTGFAGDEYVGEFLDQAHKDAEALRALLKRAGS